MTQGITKQPRAARIDRTVVDQELTVEYWRERYHTVFKRFESVTEVATEVGKLDTELADAKGFLRVRNVHADRAGLRITAKVVRLMEELRPEANENRPLRRQKITRK